LYLYFSQYLCQLLEEYLDSEEVYIPEEAEADGQIGAEADSSVVAEAEAVALEVFPEVVAVSVVAVQAEDGKSIINVQCSMYN
jgi:hypothetical protein